jgi:hypothetical protein
MKGKPNDIFAGTFLGEVAKILAKGKFTEPDEPVAGGEEVIGEMTLLEKAVFHLAVAKIKKIKKICGGCSHDKGRNVLLLKRQVDVLSRFKWTIILERLGIDSNTIIGVRQGYKIVKLPVKWEDAESSFDIIDIITGLFFSYRFEI